MKRRRISSPAFDARALAVLQRLAGADVRSHHSYSVTLAAALAATGDAMAAAQALQTAIGLTEDAGLRSFLKRR